jgi:biotin carboxylase
LPGDVVAACTSQARDALRALGMTFGAAHVEMRVTEAGPVLIEVNARLAGDRIPDLVELATGIPLVREFIRMHLRQRPDLTRTRDGGAAIRFLPGSPGVLRRVRGEEVARRVPGLVELVFETSPGQTLGELRDDHNRVAYAIASARTAYLAGRVAETALHQLVVDIEPSPSDEPLSRAAASAPTAGT